MIRLFKVFTDDDAALRLLRGAIQRGYLGQGPLNAEFEQMLGEFLDADVLTLNSCTSALDLALHMIGVDHGDEVISTPVTCTATNGVIVNRGAKIVWADVDPTTGLIDPEDVRRKVNHRTAAIMAVDWAGRSADYDRLRHETDGDIPIIQDAAHNLMAEGPRGDYVCWSFQAIKHLTTGDGGAIAVPYDEHKRAKLLRWYGLDRETSTSYRCEQDVEEAGYKYHMNDMASALGLANLPHMPWIVRTHRETADYYQALLRYCPQVQIPPASKESSWWLYTVLVEDPQDFIRHMGERGIECSPVHKRNDVHTAFSRNAGTDHYLPGVDAFADHEVAIPVGWWLSELDKATVVRGVQEYEPAKT